jgi:hypothetical protein
MTSLTELLNRPSFSNIISLKDKILEVYRITDIIKPIMPKILTIFLTPISLRTFNREIEERAITSLHSHDKISLLTDEINLYFQEYQFDLLEEKYY